MSKMGMLENELIETSSWGVCSTELQKKLYKDILHDCTIRFEDTYGNVIDASGITDHSEYMVGIESPVWSGKSLTYVANIAFNIARDIENCGYYCLTNYTEDIYDNGFDCIQDDIDPRDVSILGTNAVYVLAR